MTHGRGLDRAVPSFLADAKALVLDFVAFGGARLWATIALILVGGLLEGIGLALLLPIFSLLAPEAGGRWRALAAHAFAVVGVGRRTDQLGVVLAGFCLIVFVRALVLSTRDRMLSGLSLGFVDHQRLKVVDDLAHARWSSLARLRHSRIAHILSSEISRLALACSILMQIVVAFVMLAAQSILIVILSPLMGLTVFGITLLGLATILPLSRRAASIGRSSTRSAFRIASEASQFLGGLKRAIAHDLADAFVAQIGSESARLRAGQDDQRRLQSHVSIASTSLAALAGAAFLFAGVLFDVPTVTLLATLVVLARMSGPVRSLQANVQQLFDVLPAFTALRDLYRDLEMSVRNPQRGEDAPLAPWRAIRFVDVGFRYPNAPTPVFDRLDVRMDAGETLGIAGPSGTGKTSFVDLLAGLLEPTTGAILIGATPLGDETIAPWRRRLAYVAQDSYLINDSVRRNLTWGLPERADQELWRFLAEAGAADLIAAMPDGLDTIVDERGSRLSGGERQRIALARAMLRDPDLLILDEATNAIDVATEQRVIANIRRSLPNATILIVAHRAETLQACDRVLSLAAGQPSAMRTADAQTNRPTSASAGSTG